MRFDRERHMAPRFDARGKDMPEQALTQSQTNILTEGHKIPNTWSQLIAGGERPKNMTQKKLFSQRTKSAIPDKSYDLDGDGFVSMTDHFLAKRFDKDQDGKLNAEEFSAAKKALAEGYSD